MSGHNKWSSIKHRKGAQDAKRGKVFTKIIKEIVVAVRESGKDPDMNSKLKNILVKAREANMPKDTVNNAIKRGAGEIQGETYDEISYEGYGPAGVAVLVRTLTDNRNRTASDIRFLFSKYGGNLGETGCVGWLFDRKGQILVPAEGITEDKLMEVALEAGAEDIEQDESGFTVCTDPTELSTVHEAIEGAGIKVESAEVAMIPQNTVRLEGKEAERMLKLMDALEDNDDVQDVSANFEIDEEIIEQFMAG